MRLTLPHRLRPMLTATALSFAMNLAAPTSEAWSADGQGSNKSTSIAAGIASPAGDLRMLSEEMLQEGWRMIAAELPSTDGARIWGDLQILDREGRTVAVADRLEIAPEGAGDRGQQLPGGATDAAFTVSLTSPSIFLPGATVRLADLHISALHRSESGTLIVRQMSGTDMEATSDGGSHRLNAARVALSGLAIDPQLLLSSLAGLAQTAGGSRAPDPRIRQMAELTSAFALAPRSAILVERPIWQRNEKTLAEADRFMFLRDGEQADGEFGLSKLRLSPALAGTPLAHHLLARLDGDHAAFSDGVIPGSLHGTLSGSRANFRARSTLLLDGIGRTEVAIAREASPDGSQDGSSSRPVASSDEASRLELTVRLHEDRVFERLVGDAGRRDGLARIVAMTGGRSALAFLPLPDAFRADEQAMGKLRATLDDLISATADWIRGGGAMEINGSIGSKDLTAVAGAGISIGAAIELAGRAGVKAQVVQESR